MRQFPYIASSIQIEVQHLLVYNILLMRKRVERLTISDYLIKYTDAYETAILMMSFYDVTTQWKSGEV